MPTKGERASEKKFVKTPGGRVTIHFFKGKAGKHHCALCACELHGVPHGQRTSGVRKLAKTKRRPNVPFGGTLCSNCRETVFVEAAKVKHGFKEIGAVSLKEKGFVEMALNRVE